MNTYQFINPSDKVTFLAESDEVAVITSQLISQESTTTNLTTGKKLQGFFGFLSEEEFKVIEQELFNMPAVQFSAENKEQIRTALSSFCHLDQEERGQFDTALKELQGNALEAYLAHHLDKYQTSMNPICARAWEFSKAIEL